MSIKLTSPKIADFDEYFNNLNPYTNTWNPWFREFWAKTYNCTFDDDLVLSKGLKKCTGWQDIASSFNVFFFYKKMNKMPM